MATTQEQLVIFLFGTEYKIGVFDALNMAADQSDQALPAVTAITAVKQVQARFQTGTQQGLF